MHHLRALSAWIVLASFLLGGVLGPVVHEGHHAAEAAHASQEVCHIDAAHNADGPVAVSDANATAFADCKFCATRHVATSHERVRPPRPALGYGTWVASLDSQTSVSHVDVPIIRGPPLFS